QFKLENQLIKRRQEFDMAQHLTLDKIDYWEESILVGEKKYFLANTCFQTINPQHPDQLIAEEEEVVASLLDSFQHSLQLKNHISFLMKKGS
ncbi:fructose-bisphosphatase class III, partial [Streptococcus oralis]